METWNKSNSLLVWLSPSQDSRANLPPLDESSSLFPFLVKKTMSGHLATREMHIEKITDLKDGVLLCHLIETISEKVDTSLTSVLSLCVGSGRVSQSPQRSA